MRASDTDVVVRYLTGEHPEQSARARALIDAGAVFVPVIVVLEVEWVLRIAYGFRPPEVARALRAFGGLPTVAIGNAETVALALDRSEHGLDFADALRLGLSRHCDGFATFDRALAKPASAVDLPVIKV